VRKATVAFALTIIFSGIGVLFWYQEGQYLLPTPLPKDYQPIEPGQLVRLESVSLRQDSTNKLLHFFNPDCPCSRFNLKHFLALKKKYSSVKFYVVVTDEVKGSRAKEMLDPGIDIIVDSDQSLAEKCGVYSTPQAALLDVDNKLFFRGNYNRARYCTDKNSNFVQMALDSLMANREPPRFNAIATTSYGCTLPTNENPSFLP
jgi:hypothetical protein